MKIPLRTILPGAALLVVAVATGCGAGNVIDAAKTEIAVRYDVEGSTGVNVESVACPTGVPASPGTRFTCRVDARNGDLAVAELVVKTTRGDMRLVRLRRP